ncbi:MAG: LapA family protein [Syntrophomonadaceae bacterium]|jgi:uncharacterized integral membrane protein
MPLYLIGALIFTIGIAVFVFQNTAVVSIRYLNWASPEVSLAIVVLIAACAGALITFLLDSFRYYKLARQEKELHQLNKKLQKELNRLKTDTVAKSTEKASHSKDSKDSVKEPDNKTDNTQQ